FNYDFFFQAEDDIRDIHVTGVQTCALPISQPGLGRERAVGLPGHALAVVAAAEAAGRDQVAAVGVGGRVLVGAGQRQVRLAALRSEERRVGKEDRLRWESRYY